jgi:hypothetical protein
MVLSGGEGEGAEMEVGGAEVEFQILQRRSRSGNVGRSIFYGRAGVAAESVS